MKEDVTLKQYSKIACIILGAVILALILGEIAEFAGVLYKKMYLLK